MDKKQLIAIGISALILILLVQSVSAAWVNSSFTRRASILINNTGNVDNLTDYQVFLNYSYDSDMQLNFNDTRIYNQTHYDLYLNESNSTTPFWLENKSDGNWSRIWGNYTYLKASAWTNDTFYLYYKHPTASSASDGDATFEFFADKHTTSGWNTDSGGTVATDGDFLKFTFPSGSWKATYHSISVPSKYIYENRFKTLYTGTNTHIDQSICDGGIANIFAQGVTPENIDPTHFTYRVGGSWPPFADFILGTEHILKIIVDESDSITGIDYYAYTTSRTLLGSALGKAFTYGSPTVADQILYQGDLIQPNSFLYDGCFFVNTPRLSLMLYSVRNNHTVLEPHHPSQT